MRLDSATLLAATFLLTFVVGLLFLFSWRQSRPAPALLIWGIAHLIGAVASAGLAARGLIPDLLSIGLANAAVLAAYGLIWAGITVFEGRRFRPAATFGGAALWALLCCVPAFYADISARVIAASGIACLYMGAGALLFWRRGAEPLASRRAAAVLLAVYAVCYGVRIPATLLAPPVTTPNPLDSPWITILCLASMLLTLAVAFLFTALTKERAEHRQRVAASTDGLTGVANRRAFVDHAEATAARGQAVTLVLFDLDHFKGINDTFGHMVGDTVLIAFCEVAAVLLPPGMRIGRLGGEEFACLLTGHPEAALVQADSVRRAFAAIRIAALPDLRLSASAGLAQGRGEPFDALMRRADTALYAAKNGGRNRVAVADTLLPAAA